MLAIKTVINVLGIICFFFLVTINTSCKKETIKEVAAKVDSIAVTKGLYIGKWFVQMHERELYSGTTFTGKALEYFAGTNTYSEYKADMTYTSMYKGAPAGGGIWEILSGNYMVMDKGNPSQERYYYIIALDSKVMITRGPFKANGTLFFPSDLYTTYSAK